MQSAIYGSQRYSTNNNLMFDQNVYITSNSYQKWLKIFGVGSNAFYNDDLYLDLNSRACTQQFLCGFDLRCPGQPQFSTSLHIVTHFGHRQVNIYQYTSIHIIDMSLAIHVIDTSIHVIDTSIHVIDTSTHIVTHHQYINTCHQHQYLSLTYPFQPLTYQYTTLHINDKV